MKALFDEFGKKIFLTLSPAPKREVRQKKRLDGTGSLLFSPVVLFAMALVPGSLRAARKIVDIWKSDTYLSTALKLITVTVLGKTVLTAECCEGQTIGNGIDPEPGTFDYDLHRHNLDPDLPNPNWNSRD